VTPRLNEKKYLLKNSGLFLQNTLEKNIFLNINELLSQTGKNNKIKPLD
jgi:hypothetical protein